MSTWNAFWAFVCIGIYVGAILLAAIFYHGDYR